ncbi:MAG: 4-alpha-glucanotransferase, partial [Erysipelotrichia bacterium]|nr:4-alpha-glucanotransferase [Erysipelotrichia bacterium]
MSVQNKFGVLLPISALPGNHGIGDFSSGAFAFVDWLKKVNYRYWQILPLNPLGPG